MKKVEKKKIINDLLAKAENGQTLELMEKILAKVIIEIYSSGFTLQHLKKVSVIIDTFIKDIPLDYSNDFKFLSKAALTTAIDWSLLED